MPDDIIVHGVEWTVKELFVYPNEYIYWSIQIVMYLSLIHISEPTRPMKESRIAN